MKNSMLPVDIGKNLHWFAVALLCLMQTLVYAGSLTTDYITVNKDTTIHGNLQLAKAVGTAPTNGLLLYYSLNTNTTPVPDDSGHTNTGTVYGGTGWTTNGETGGSYYFGGTNGYIDAGAPASLNILTPNITMSAWIRPLSGVTYYYTGIVDKNYQYIMALSGTHLYA